MGHPLPRLRQLGYDDATLRQLSRSRLTSSNATYESRWRLFAAYCADHGVDPFRASPAQISNFLTHIAATRHASVSTLAGYRTAIGHVVRLVTGFDPGSDALLSQLMKSFRRTQPVTAMRVPEWDVTLVLNTLLSSDCHNSMLSLHTLTAKTVFLVALASGERRHALAALASPPVFSSESVTLRFLQDFIPKSYFLRTNLSRIGPLTIPACPSRLRQVCPVATLRAYVDCVAPLRRATQTSLFIPHNVANPNNVSVQAIGRYLVHLIRFCYAASAAALPACRAHDVRKVAAALRALTSVSLDAVLDAGQWSSPNTFLQYYNVQLRRSTQTDIRQFTGLPAGRSTLCFQDEESRLSE